jgi:hypothetical protein
MRSVSCTNERKLLAMDPLLYGNERKDTVLKRESICYG